jgi:hypothetical protein
MKIQLIGKEIISLTPENQAEEYQLAGIYTEVNNKLRIKASEAGFKELKLYIQTEPEIRQ